MAEVDDSLIYQGFWINHDQGTVLGATITTTQKKAQVIVALVAVVVTVAAASTWNLLQFTVHQARATSAPRDGLFRQQQVLLRSLASPGTVLADSIKMLFVWRSAGPKQAYMRCLIPALLGFGYALASLAAGVFSSSVVNTSDLEVLMGGSACRMWNSTAYANYDPNDIPSAFRSTVDAATRNYAEQCYTTGPGSSQCRSYVQPRFETNHSTENCPFHPSICTQTGAVVLDTGYLDSHHAFGINAPPADRVQLRRKTTCTPLNVQDYTSLLHPDEFGFVGTYDRNPFPTEQVWVFHYGNEPGDSENRTLYSSTITSNVTMRYDALVAKSYSSPSLQDLSGFAPIDELRINNADLVLIFIFSNSMYSAQPIDDPIYAAHRLVNYTVVDSDGSLFNETMYQADQPAGVLGCTEQYDHCITKPNRHPGRECTGLTGVIEHEFRSLLPSASERQLATLDTIAAATSFAGLDNAISMSDPPFLNATSHAFSLNGPMANSQWVFDVQKMEGYVRAQLQWMITMHAAGFPIDSSYTIPPSTAAQEAICRRQKVIKQGGFANINAFGLFFTVAFFVLVTILDFGILRFLLLADRPAKRFPTHFWVQDGIYQVQKTAYEALNAAAWTRETKEVPRTTGMLKDLATYHNASATGLIVSTSGRSSQSTPTLSVTRGRTSSTPSLRLAGSTPDACSAAPVSAATTVTSSPTATNQLNFEDVKDIPAANETVSASTQNQSASNTASEATKST